MSEEQRHSPAGERREDNKGLWGKLTLPLLIAILIHAGTIVWWARGIQESVQSVKEKQDYVQAHMLEKLTDLSTSLSESRLDIKENQTKILRCMIRIRGDDG